MEQMDKREYDQIEEAANRLQHEASVKCSRELEKARLKPWIDREGKYIGENYLREIVKGIDNSEMMLFVSSKNSNNSYYALKEVCYAADNKMKILPLLLDDSPFNEDIKLLFSAKDKRWFHPNTSKTLEELTDSIKKYIDDIAKKEREKAEAEEAERRRIEAENERKRVEAEEKIRIAKLEKEIESPVPIIIAFMPIYCGRKTMPIIINMLPST